MHGPVMHGTYALDSLGTAMLSDDETQHDRRDGGLAEWWRVGGGTMARTGNDEQVDRAETV